MPPVSRAAPVPRRRQSVPPGAASSRSTAAPAADTTGTKHARGAIGTNHANDTKAAKGAKGTTGTNGTAGANGTRSAEGPRVANLGGDLDGMASARVLKQFRVVFNAVKTHFQQVEHHAGLGGAQVWALSLVRDRPGLGVNDLAAAMSVRQPTASNLVKSLAQHELIEIRRDGPDRRTVQLHIRPTGRQLLRRVPGPFSGVLPAALESLEPEVLQRLEADLARLIHELGADTGAGGVPLAQL